MKKQLTFLSSLLLSCTLFIGQAQDEKEGKITIEITKEVNGEKQTFKGEYENEEQMKADPNYREFVGEDDSFNFWLDTGEEEQDIFLHLDRFKDDHASFFKFDFDNEDEGPFHFRHFDNGDSSFVQFFDDWDDDVSERLKDMGIDMQALIDRFDGEGEQRVIVISKRVRVTDLEGDEFGKKGEVSKSEKLELDDLQFFPNPSSDGRIRLRFSVPEEDEVNIKVFDLDGREVYNRYFERFGGTYSESIDLSDQKEGMYLLEISLGKKRLTKKILIN